MDTVDRKTRTRMMSGIRSTDTKPEMAVRRFLHGHGLRFRLHARDLPGSPDIVLPRHRAVVFVNGCYWHRHGGCRYSYSPKSNVGFWTAKFKANVERDSRNYSALKALGWHVLIIWGCESADPYLLDRLRRAILIGEE